MATSEQLIPIPGRLHSLAPEGHVAGADEIYDDDLQKSQSDINADVKVMGASGENHSKGLVPDPGATQGTSKYLREDGTWAQPDGQNYTAGDGIDITSNAISVKVGTNLSIDSSGNLNAADTTYSVMGASGSTHASGLVPDTPSTAGTTKFLREDGTWQEPAGQNYSAGDGIDISNNEISVDSTVIYTKTQVDGQFMVIVNSNSAPTSSTLTYTSTDGTTKSFKVGDEIRVPDAEADNGYTFYKLYALTTEESVTTATWDKLGAGGTSGPTEDSLIIQLAQVGGNTTDLIDATITIKDNNNTTIYTFTWAGSPIQVSISNVVSYTVSVSAITGYVTPKSKSYVLTGESKNIKLTYTNSIGVYIEDTEHNMYTSSTWDSSKTPNAVCVFSTSHKFRMAVFDTAIPTKPYADAKYSDITNYVPTETNVSVAGSNFNGKYNTGKIVEFCAVHNINNDNYAGPYCNNYVFPDRETTGCLMAPGQFLLFASNKTAVNTCLSTIGKTQLTITGGSATYWTSMLYNYETPWYGNTNNNELAGSSDRQGTSPYGICVPIADYE